MPGSIDDGHDHAADDDVTYEGTSAFLRWWPKGMLALALAVLLIGWTRSVQWASLFVLVAYIHGRWIPWRFAVLDEGLLLTFPFGRRVFLPKSTTRVRVEYAGAAVALIGRRRRFGYPLVDRVLYQPGQGPRLYAALTVAGYDVVQ